MRDDSHTCAFCGLTCSLDDAPAHFNRKPTGRHGLDHRCKTCFAAYNRQRYHARRNDPAFIEQKKRKNRASYRRRKDDWHYKEQKRRSALASYHRRKGRTVDESNTNRTAEPNKSTREPGTAPAVVLARALAQTDAALAQMNSSDPKLVQFRRVVQAVWAQVAPDEINDAAKGA